MQKNMNIDTGAITFTFSDNDGEVFASFKMNPTDPRFLTRCKNMGNFFEDVVAGAIKTPSPSEYEELVEQKFCEFLGYDCKASLFGRIAATDLMRDGRSFASHILDTMIENVAPELRRRRAENLARYTAKYSK